MARKAPQYVKNLSDDQIREMFMMRSKGLTLKRISDHFNMSQETSRRVLVRQSRAEVDVPDNIVEAAAELQQGQGISKPKPRKTCKLTRAKALAAFGESVMLLEEAGIECKKHGITEESLQLFADTMRSN